VANVPKPLSEKDLAEVEMLAGLGMRYEDIALTKGVCLETLKKYAGEMLDRGKAKAKAQVMQSAFKMALSGKHPAMTTFWLKTQCGWREKGVEQPVTVNIQAKPVEGVTQQLAEALQQVSQGQLEPKVASSIATVSNALLKAIQQGDMEQRLATLETILHPKSTPTLSDLGIEI
jgi:hypothetical protein